MKTQIFIEHNQNRLGSKEICDKVKTLWVETGNKIKEINSLNIYIKPEDNMIYYVINENFTGSFPL
ncbi:DUF6465 family protein [Anaerosacchariphilus polymeriproducens]|uniref:Uncharacterized protein n=1 Tax=Anaerosacchariphilus polymeriproducens TaxID=1812858 RepID=A0A371B037_9FIRM|nr:DUF6465 family protein [Anaerosacchariphilus polymeriproducens]RDU25171.1 hypothetical protein DWV06_00650 [Anaerosacchariphilus polymeriproducens]